MRKEANPLIWGAWGGIVGGLIAFVAELSGSPMPQSVFAAGMGGFFWLWVVANIRNKLASRRPRS